MSEIRLDQYSGKTFRVYWINEGGHEYGSTMLDSGIRREAIIEAATKFKVQYQTLSLMQAESGLWPIGFVVREET